MKIKLILEESDLEEIYMAGYSAGVIDEAGGFPVDYKAHYHAWKKEYIYDWREKIEIQGKLNDH